MEEHTGISNRRSLNAYVATRYATGHLDELVSDLEIPPEVWQAVEGVVLAAVYLAVGATKQVGNLASYLASHAEIVLFLAIEYGPKVLGLGNLSDDELINAIGGEGAAERVKAAKKKKGSWLNRALGKLGLGKAARGWLLVGYLAFKYRHELQGAGAALIEDFVPEETQEFLKPLGDVVTGEKDIDFLGGIRDNQRKIDELVGPGPSKTTWWPFKAHGGLIGDDPMRQKFYSKGGKIGNKVSKIYKEGYTAPGQAYAIAKSMGYQSGGKVTGSLPMKDKFYQMSGRQQRRQDPEGRYKQRVAESGAWSTVIDFIPIIGDIKGAVELTQELRKDPINWAVVAGLTAALAIGLIPGLGDAAAAGIKKAVKSAADAGRLAPADLMGILRAAKDGDVEFLKGWGVPTDTNISRSVGMEAGEGTAYLPKDFKTKDYTSKTFTDDVGLKTGGILVPKQFLKTGTIEDWQKLTPRERIKIRWETEGKPTFSVSSAISDADANVQSRIFFDSFETFRSATTLGYHAPFNPGGFAAQGFPSKVGSTTSTIRHETGHAIDSALISKDRFRRATIPKDEFLDEDMVNELVPLVGNRRVRASIEKSITDTADMNIKYAHNQKRIDQVIKGREEDLKRLSETSDESLGNQYLKGGYRESEHDAEMIADAFAALGEDPAKLKQVAPKSYKMLIDRINNDDLIRQIIDTQTSQGVPLSTVVGSLAALGISTSVINNAIGGEVIYGNRT